MGYDPIEVEQAARQAARAIRKSGGAGYSEHLTASFVIPAPEDVTTDVTLMGTGFKWFSSATPTKEEFLSGKLTATKDGYSVSMGISELEHSVVAEATGAYCVRVEHLNYIVATVTENELGTLPKPGIYYSSTQIIGDPEKFIAGTKFAFDFDERIHPIDPKYLPGVCLPVVELSTPVAKEVIFTDAENAALNEAFNKDTPFVLKCDSIVTSSFGAFTDCKLIAYSATGSGFRVITSQVLTVRISLQSTDGSTWICGIGEG